MILKYFNKIDEIYKKKNIISIGNFNGEIGNNAIQDNKYKSYGC